MSSTMFGDLLADNVVLNETEKQMVADYQAVRALNIFSDDDFNILGDYVAKHFHKWCVEVLVADFWDLFKAKENEDSKNKVRTLKHAFRQALIKGYLLQENQEFNLGFNYEQHIWRCPRTIHDYGVTQEQLRRENELMQTEMDQFRLKRMQPTIIPDVKQGEDVASVNVPADIKVEAVLGKHKSESAAEKSRKHKAMTKNARRRAGGGNLTCGYMKLPKDRAVFQPWTGTYAPTIQIENMQNLEALDFEFPKDTREHGFMVSCNGLTLFWNKYKQDFQPEVITIKI